MAVFNEINGLSQKEPEFLFSLPTAAPPGPFPPSGELRTGHKRLALLDSTNRDFQKEKLASRRADAGDGRRSARAYCLFGVVSCAPPSIACNSAVEGALMLLFSFLSIVKHSSLTALSLTASEIFAT
ncbi:MAG: hypothetical protein ACLPGW_06660 [Roseiarcus sp.]